MLRIKDWNDHYENNRTRILKKLDWVPIPNAMDGLGYISLMDHPNAAAHFGAWIAMVEIASRCDPRGTLQRNGKDLSDITLSVLSRIPACVFTEAIPRLVEIGWLEHIAQESAVIRHLGAAPNGNAVPEGRHSEAHADPSTKEGKKEGKEGKESAGANSPLDPSDPEAQSDISEDTVKPSPVVNADWFEFKATAEAAGMSGSSTDWDDAWRFEYRRLDGLQKVAALNGIKVRRGTDDFALKALPQNYLQRRMWERKSRKQRAEDDGPHYPDWTHGRPKDA